MRHLMFVLAALCALACQSVPAAATPVTFDLQDAKTGETYSSTDHLGKPMVLEFYFNGCPACNQNAANVHDLAQKYAGKAEVVEISIDCDAGDYRDWIRKHNPLGPVLDDCERSVGSELNVSRYPTTVVLDAQHDIVYRTVGVWSVSTKRRIEQELNGSH